MSTGSGTPRLRLRRWRSGVDPAGEAGERWNPSWPDGGGQDDPPRSLTDLQEWLDLAGIPRGTWGVGVSKSVDDLWSEVASGETVLSKSPPLRQIAAVSVIIQVGGRRLVEARQLMANGSVRERNSPPAEKMLPGETPADAARRCLAEELGVDESRVTLDLTRAKVATRRTESPSYPGLTTSYRLWTIPAEVSGLPAADFTTDEASGDKHAAVSTHYWEWHRPTGRIRRLWR